MSQEISPVNVSTVELAAGSLSADATGRALIASEFFNEATVDAKFAAGAIDAQDRLKAGSVTTDRINGSAVTGAKLSSTALKVIGFTGKNGAGACTLTGAAVGDRVLGVVETTATDAAAAAKFESTITVVNEIQQTDAGDLSSKRYFAVLVIASA